MESPGDRMREFFDPHTEILRAHRKCYQAKFGHTWILGERAHQLDKSARILRRFRDDQSEREVRSTTEKHKSGDSPSRPISHGENEILDTLVARRSRVLVTGDGGIGKSESIRYWAFELAQSMQVEEAGDLTLRVPVWINLKTFRLTEPKPSAIKYEPLLESIFTELKSACNEWGDGQEFFMKLATRGQIILLLDGVDEMERKSARRLESMLPLALGEGGQLHTCALVLCTRQLALCPSLSNLFKLSERFTPELLANHEVESYIQHVFSASGQTAVQGQRLIKAIQTVGNGVRELVRWPLLLALTCIAHEQGMIEFPKSPARLMEKALKKLLERRGIKHVAAFIAVLADLAHDALIHAGPITQNRAVIRILSLKEIPGPFRDAFAGVPAEEMLAELSTRTGFFFGSPSDDYHFSIKPLAEYLAGHYLGQLAEDVIIEAFTSHSWHPRWQQPLYWMAGELWQGTPERRLLAAQMLDSLLEHHKRHYDDVTHTLLRLAELFLIAAGEGNLSEASVNCYVEIMRAAEDSDFYSMPPLGAGDEELASLNPDRFPKALMNSPFELMPTQVRAGIAQWLARGIRYFEEHDGGWDWECQMIAKAARMGSPLPDLIDELRGIMFRCGREAAVRVAAYRALLSLGCYFAVTEEERFLSDQEIKTQWDAEESARELWEMSPTELNLASCFRRQPDYSLQDAGPDLVTWDSVELVFNSFGWEPFLELCRRDEALFRGRSDELFNRLAMLGAVVGSVSKLGSGRDPLSGKNVVASVPASRNDWDCFLLVKREELRIANELRPKGTDPSTVSHIPNAVLLPTTSGAAPADSGLSPLQRAILEMLATAEGKLDPTKLTHEIIHTRLNKGKDEEDREFVNLTRCKEAVRWLKDRRLIEGERSGFRLTGAGWKRAGKQPPSER